MTFAFRAGLSPPAFDGTGSGFLERTPVIPRKSRRKPARTMNARRVRRSFISGQKGER
jgi:hypothetical protein